MHYFLFYDVSPDYLARRKEFRDEHLALAWQFAARGELLLGGALSDPVDAAVLLFRGDSPEVVERFVRDDPYVAHGLVLSWRIRGWTTVVGDLAESPVRPQAPVSLRPAEPSDLDTLVTLSRAFYDHFRYPWTEEQPRAIAALLADPSAGRVWLILVDGQPAGYVILSFFFSVERGGRTAFVDELFVLPGSRKRGAGGEVLDLVAKECPRLGVRALHAEIEPGNTGIASLSRRHGWVDTGRLLLTRRID